MADPSFMSTTALAKRLAKEPKEVFTLLARAHWMLKVDDRWQLTEKGRFEGGTYLQHPKYGDYVAWPEAVIDHPLWRSLPEAPLTASQLGQKLGLPARLLNLLLADLGWLERGPRGWLLSRLGLTLGGQQHRAEASGVPYATWPERLQSDPRLLASVADLSQGRGLDGRHYPDPGLGRLAGWLYLHGLCFATGRQLPGAPGPASLFLPGAQLIVQYWPPVADGAALQAKLAMQKWLADWPSALQLEAEAVADLAQLDERLPGLLLAQGLATY